jgi:hypothetical protein
VQRSRRKVNRQLRPARLENVLIAASVPIGQNFIVRDRLVAILIGQEQFSW